MSTLRTHARNETKKGSTYPEYSAYHYIRLKAITRVANCAVDFPPFSYFSNSQKNRINKDQKYVYIA